MAVVGRSEGEVAADPGWRRRRQQAEAAASSPVLGVVGSRQG